jgi:hypothetical protein
VVAGSVASVSAAAPARAQRQDENEMMVTPPTDRAERNAAKLAVRSGYGVAKSCLRFDSPDADARWADQPFPFVIVIDSGTTSASVLTAAGEPTQLRAVWTPTGGDSVSVRLRRIGYSGSIVLGPEAGTRTGFAVSAVAPTMLEQVEVGGARPTAEARARAEAPSADSRKTSAAAVPQRAPTSGPPVRQLRVTARDVACPAR